MQTVQQVKLCRDVPDTIFKKGEQGTIVEYLPLKKHPQLPRVELPTQSPKTELFS
jgi:hypothetical protein